MARRRPPHRPLTIGSSHWREDGRPKVRYATEGDANAAAEELWHETGADLGVYRCAFCNGWHMGRRGRRGDD